MAPVDEPTVGGSGVQQVVAGVVGLSEAIHVEIIVIGSTSILGQFPNAPAEMLGSIATALAEWLV